MKIFRIRFKNKYEVDVECENVIDAAFNAINEFWPRLRKPEKYLKDIVSIKQVKRDKK